MNKILFVIIILIIALASCYAGGIAQDWESLGMSNAKIEIINADQIYGQMDDFSYEINPTLVIFRGSKWSRALVVEKLRETAHIYKQCGLKFDKVTLVQVDPYLGKDKYLDIDNKNKNVEAIVSHTPPVSKPIIYFVRKGQGVKLSRQERSRYVDNPKYLDRTAFAFRERNGNFSGVSVNTAWMTEVILSKKYLESVDPSYSPTAHELGHLIFDTGHTDGRRNLMAGSRSGGNDYILERFCSRKMPKSSLVRPAGM